MKLRGPLGLALVLSLTSSTALAARAYEGKGPLETETKTLDASTRVVAPKTGGPYPLVVASHGFSATGDNQIGWAEHFASWGLVVAVPSFPTPLQPDTKVNAGIITSLAKDLGGPRAAEMKVRPGALGLEGHSAGGLATAAAAEGLSPGAVVLFDPVDRDNVGKAAYAKTCAPTLAIFAGPSSCNNQAAWRAFATDTLGDVLTFAVKGSTHCDGENAPRGLCGTFCGGGASATRQQAYAHYATALFLARLSGDAAAQAALQDAATSADADLDGVTRKASTCANADAGAPEAGAPAPAPTGGSSGTGSSGATPGGDAGAGEGLAPADTSGCACHAGGGERGLASPFAAIGLAALAAARRRQRPASARPAQKTPSAHD